ncbi:hypothetical protein H5410_001383 [Solanum commersonii]|uniref:Cyclin N-terminal domain-containing protein n=1 Tax=Solanum commersonii TaxID=4109 RepID=A0A9J6AZD9_SOLCO|nr:hypothetical protein H5410_001383 [Solanum commersonii]
MKILKNLLSMNHTHLRMKGTKDRFLEKQGIVRKKFYLIDLAEMLLACKYDEVYVPLEEEGFGVDFR